MLIKNTHIWAHKVIILNYFIVMRKIKYPRATSKPRDESEQKLLQKIGRKIHQDLYDEGKPIEHLAWESEVARSTVQRVFEANRNVGILTLDRIVKGLGYKSIIEFLNTI